MDCSGGSTCAGGRWRRGLDGEGVLVVEGGREGAGELRGVEAKLDVGSIWAERLWRRGSTAGLRLAGFRWSGGGVPGCLGRERARGRGKRNEESSLEPRHAQDGSPRCCSGPSTAAARWQPRGGSGRRGVHAPGQRSSLGSDGDLPGDVWRPAQRKRGPGGDPERREARRRAGDSRNRGAGWRWKTGT